MNRDMGSLMRSLQHAILEKTTTYMSVMFMTIAVLYVGTVKVHIFKYTANAIYIYIYTSSYIYIYIHIWYLRCPFVDSTGMIPAGCRKKKEAVVLRRLRRKPKKQWTRRKNGWSKRGNKSCLPQTSKCQIFKLEVVVWIFTICAAWIDIFEQ